MCMITPEMYQELQQYMGEPQSQFTPEQRLEMEAQQRQAADDFFKAMSGMSAQPASDVIDAEFEVIDEQKLIGSE